MVELTVTGWCIKATWLFLSGSSWILVSLLFIVVFYFLKFRFFVDLLYSYWLMLNLLWCTCISIFYHLRSLQKFTDLYHITLCLQLQYIDAFISSTFLVLQFLNQARAGHRPARAWFLKIEPVWIICMCVCLFACVYLFAYVCPPPRLLITNGVI